MAYYIALIHKDADSSYGISFPDLPGVTAAADTIDEAIKRGEEALTFAADHWADLDLGRFPDPRSIDDLRRDEEFMAESADAVVAAIPMLNAAAVAA